MVNQRGSMFLLVNTVTSRNSKDLTPLNCASFSNFITQHYLSFEISFGIIQGTNYLLSIYPSLYSSINYLSVMNGVTSQFCFHIWKLSTGNQMYLQYKSSNLKLNLKLYYKMDIIGVKMKISFQV